MDNEKTLVAYFSCSGVTQRAAQALAEGIGADLYEIKPEMPYTEEDLNWKNPKSRSSLEMKEAASRPAIAKGDLDLSSYRRVFIGFPIWWYVAPAIVNTFLESYDFSGKTLVPFATSGGSGLGKTEEKLHSLCKTADWRPGKLWNGPVSASALARWAALL